MFTQDTLSFLKAIVKTENNPIIKYLIEHMSSDSKKIKLDVYSEIDIFAPKQPGASDKLMCRCYSTKEKRHVYISFIKVLQDVIEFDSINRQVKTFSINDTQYCYDVDARMCFSEKKGDLFPFLINPSLFTKIKTKSNVIKSFVFSDPIYEATANEIKKSIDTDYTIEEISGDDIVQYYRAENYDETLGCSGPLYASCMRHDSSSDFIQFYAHTENTRMIVLRKSSDKILGRAMLFNSNEGWFMDRRYFVKDFMEGYFVDYAKSKGYHYRTNCSADSERSITFCKNGEYIPSKNAHISIHFKLNEKYAYDSCPWMDTFKVGYSFMDNNNTDLHLFATNRDLNTNDMLTPEGLRSTSGSTYNYGYRSHRVNILDDRSCEDVVLVDGVIHNKRNLNQDGKNIYKQD